AAIMLSAPALARSGRFDQVRAAYEMAVAEKAPRAHEILGELGFAYVRAGRIDDGLAVAAELRKTPEKAAAPDSRPGGAKPAEGVRALTGKPFAANSRRQSYLLALAALAQGLAEQGKDREARPVLVEIDVDIAAAKDPSSTMDRIRAETAEAY